MIYKKLICLGDSITEGFGDRLCLGWVGRLGQQLNTPDKEDVLWSVSNQGVGGDTIADGKHRLAPALFNYPSHILLAFGTNDMCTIMWPEGTETKMSLDYSKQTWLQIFSQLKLHSCKVAVVGLLPVLEKEMPFKFVPYDENDRGYSFSNQDQKKYNDMLRVICEQSGIQMIDLFDDWLNRDDLPTLLCDGLHPGTAGYDLMADQVYSELSRTGFLE